MKKNWKIIIVVSAIIVTCMCIMISLISFMYIREKYIVEPTYQETITNPYEDTHKIEVTSTPIQNQISTSTPYITIIPSHSNVDNKLNCNGASNDIVGIQTIDNNFNDIRNKFSLCISLFSAPTESDPDLTFDVLDAQDIDDLRNLSRLFDEEYSKYSVDFIKNLNLVQVVFVKNLAVNGQSRTACPDGIREVLYYDIDLATTSEIYARSTLHHELFHNLEEEIYGTYYYQDLQWIQLNEPDFEYGTGGSNCYGAMPARSQGFVSGYSKCGIEEDRAEIFAYIMEDTGSEELLMYIDSGDLILKNKTPYMIDYLESLGLDISIHL